MMQPELSQFTWPCFNNLDSSPDNFGVFGPVMDNHMSHFEFSPFTTAENTFDAFLVPDFLTMFPDELMNFPGQVHELQGEFSMEEFSLDLEDIEPILSGEIEDMCDFGEDEGGSHSHQPPIGGHGEWSLHPSTKSSDVSMDLVLPTEEMEIDNQISLDHLVGAYTEALENGQTHLAEAIMRRISKKVSPMGEILERLLYYLFQTLDKQATFLIQESRKNVNAVFKAFYQIFPHGRFAHFAANSAISEAMPHDPETIHIVDFDMGEGVQWSSMLEAIGQQQMAVLKQQQSLTFQPKVLKLTSIKWKEEDCGCTRSPWRFEDTKRWLCDHARSFGLELTVEEMELQDLVSEIKRMSKRGGRKEWLAFNCMVGLPHMGRVRCRRHVLEFLRVAKDLISNSANCTCSSRSIITIGDGDAWEKLKHCSTFGPFFNEYLIHYQALLESMEWNFPFHLPEARIAMECLFVAPHISSTVWTQRWVERREGCELQSGFGLEGCRTSIMSLMEAQEMVREGESLYGVRTEGENENEMILEWRGTPLVRVSAWN